MNYHVVEYQYYLMCKYEMAGNRHASTYRLKMLANEISKGNSDLPRKNNILCGESLEANEIERDSIAALKEAAFRYQWAITLLEKIPTCHFDINDPESIAWGLDMPGTTPCSHDENTEQIEVLHYLLSLLQQ